MTKLNSTMVFNVVNSDRDEYPDDGLYLEKDNKKYDKDFINLMGIKLQHGDEIEISVKVLSRIETKRIKLND